MIQLATVPSGDHKRVKHFLRNILYLRELINDKVIKLLYENGNELRVDELTKALGPTQHEPLASKLLTRK
jgi:hypothetical protein